MRKATKDDRKLVIDLICESFEDNPGVGWILKNGGSKNKSIKRLAKLAFIKGYRRNGVFISSNEKGVAVCYCPASKKPSLFEKIYELYFGISSIKWKHIPTVLKTESYKKSKRPSNHQYLYFWFYGVVKDGENAARELGDAVFDEARKFQLPIYLETAMERNKLVYERYGFETYHHHKVPNEHIEYWFLRWYPDHLKK
jgi:hypothetical protein